MKRWGLTPSQWAAEPRWSRLYMMGHDANEDDVKFWMVEDAKEK